MPNGSFFEDLHRSAGRNAGSIPWASLQPSPMVERWLSESAAVPGPAVVVACGLGDDAEALAADGWRVTAFDVAPTAIEWARERFPDSPVDYVVADLFELPGTWSQAFALVVEVLTIQSISPQDRPSVVGAIADLVAPDGTLLVATGGHHGPPIEAGPPWPLTRRDLDLFAPTGVEQIAFSTRPSPWDGFEHWEVEYRRPGGTRPDHPYLRGLDKLSILTIIRLYE